MGLFSFQRLPDQYMTPSLTQSSTSLYQTLIVLTLLNEIKPKSLKLSSLFIKLFYISSFGFYSALFHWTQADQTGISTLLEMVEWTQLSLVTFVTVLPNFKNFEKGCKIIINFTFSKLIFYV